MVANVLHNRPTTRIESEERKLLLQKQQNERNRLDTSQVSQHLRTSDLKAKKNLERTKGKINNYHQRMERVIRLSNKGQRSSPTPSV